VRGDSVWCNSSKGESAPAGCEFQRGGEQFLQIALDLKTAAFIAPREGWRIEDDRVEGLVLSREPWEHIPSRRPHKSDVHRDRCAFSVKFSRPRSIDLRERSMLVVTAPPSAAATEKEHV
jgi:hypothetical protein